MVSQEEFARHYNMLYDSKAIYVWGACCETVTEELIGRLYGIYSSDTYDKAYYNNRLAKGKGKTGADAPGSLYPLSREDNTVQGYYRSCIRKGSICAIPKGTACLVFNTKFTHMGAYLGNGVVIEMKDGGGDCVKQVIDSTRWTYWGIPAWLGTEGAKATLPVRTGTPVMRKVQEWCNGNYNAGIATDGEYGPQTKKALCMALQECLNKYFHACLETDGMFGEKTCKACVHANKHTHLTYIAQALLYARGYNMMRFMTNNGFDGLYGPEMETAVISFQSCTRGLKQDGKCKGATFRELFK